VPKDGFDAHVDVLDINEDTDPPEALGWFGRELVHHRTPPSKIGFSLSLGTANGAFIA
jgi:hypothetical protein